MPAIQKTVQRLKPAASSSSSNSIIQPNRMTAAFNEMKNACPDAIRLYATCVSDHHIIGSLEKGSCENEFNAVKDCFRGVRGGISRK
mmetsp:Transcript_4185/g.6137  ORF Transcript_4185/g.6137 Transcript_4185/m.6137 type:complete len:87 (-) Transcript_4185:407-667(-)|eukprot:CAMPEP_0194088010 /NCGR_PEP_ID=MMETSP0149-20130528/27458_1 /TAXON_ID=122233 /ORGANISM="Chaetoceros debilis, Strain MM31A-1" /LENGTH=86 /DNA_ID=CAMNT_0038771559 /DNA_START=227 /DNA_END=487 /DNA_ORIENTATION=+